MATVLLGSTRFHEVIKDYERENNVRLSKKDVDKLRKLLLKSQRNELKHKNKARVRNSKAFDPFGKGKHNRTMKV